MPRFSRSWRRLLMCASVVVAACLRADAATAQQSDFSLQFTSQTPATATAMRLYIVYRDPSNPNGKPSPIRHLVVHAPQGTRIDLGQPRCTASDLQIMVSGASACPVHSQIGTGTLTAITGLGPPIDPYPTDVTIFNSGQGLIEVVRDHSSGATLADDRVQIDDNTLTGNPPAIPGGPPDGQTAVRTIDFTFPALTGYITTPPSCPDGRWSSTASFTFADGSTQRVASVTPCSAATGAKTEPSTQHARTGRRATSHGQRKRHRSRHAPHRRPNPATHHAPPRDPDRDSDHD